MTSERNKVLEEIGKAAYKAKALEKDDRHDIAEALAAYRNAKEARGSPSEGNAAKGGMGLKSASSALRKAYRSFGEQVIESGYSNEAISDLIDKEHDLQAQISDEENAAKKQLGDLRSNKVGIAACIAVVLVVLGAIGSIFSDGLSSPREAATTLNGIVSKHVNGSYVERIRERKYNLKGESVDDLHPTYYIGNTTYTNWYIFPNLYSREYPVLLLDGYHVQLTVQRNIGNQGKIRVFMFVEPNRIMTKRRAAEAFLTGHFPRQGAPLDILVNP